MAAFGAYIHVPFCARRCGYCDFNTYTPAELRGAPGGTVAAYLMAVRQEMALAAQQTGERELATVFFGGGTPTALPASDLVALIEELRRHWTVAPDAEITVEANPDSVTAESLQELAAGGVTRVSFGMQSAISSVLSVLDRTHEPAAVGRGVQWARAAGLQVSLDLIYGTPGESLADWQASLDAVVALAPDHVSAYSLTVEPGTALFRRVDRGEVPSVDGDDQAAKYELADAVMREAGYSWYEVSNWATSEHTQCRHNVGYWNGSQWWGFGPGAHSFVDGRRWWNVKLPQRYSALLATGGVPVAESEIVAGEAADIERVMLAVRLRAGIKPDQVPHLDGIETLVAENLLFRDGNDLVLTIRGRLLADHVVRTLLGW